MKPSLLALGRLRTKEEDGGALMLRYSHILFEPFLRSLNESVPDMLLALGGILQSENESILCLAVDLTMELVCSLGKSICQYHVLDILMSLSCLLPTYKVSVVVSCATALNRILTNLGAMSYQYSEEVCEVIVKTNLVRSVICVMQGYGDGSQPVEYFSETACLLKTIIWRWPSFRYHVWSNSKLMDVLQGISARNDTLNTRRVLQLCSALALCGNGARKILENEELVSKIVGCTGTSHLDSVRLEALKLCQHLTRSAEVSSLLTDSYSEQIVQGIIGALGGWRSCSKIVPTDQIPLVMEAFRAALITRWAGNHHFFFWSNEIDRALLDNLIGNCSRSDQTRGMVLCDELIAKVYDNITNTRPFIWDILGWLAAYCEEDFVPKTTGKLCCLDVLIFCACAVAKDLMLKRRSSFSPDISEAEPVARAVLMLVTSPSRYIALKSKSWLFEMARPYGNDGLESFLLFLKLIAGGDVPLVSDNLQTAINLIGFACYSALPDFQKTIVKKKGLQMISDIIERCLKSDIHVSRSTIVSHLRSIPEEKTCCWNHVGDWEGGDVILFYCLQALSQLISFSMLECNQHEITSEEVVVSDADGLVEKLQFILHSNSSQGPKRYAAYILSFFGSFGTQSKLGQKMERALNENELADLQFVLSNGQSLRVHSVILWARCPDLLPKETSLKDEQESEQNPRTRQEVRMSDRVDYYSLIKILEYTYTGFLRLEEDHLKPLKILANCCRLKSLSLMLHRKLPTWGSSSPSCDFTKALEPTESSCFDIILEAEGSGGAWDCSICQLSRPHVHAHKIILWANCNYLQALFRSGMHESYSQIIKVPVGWIALTKLVNYFYSGKLLRIETDCTWKNMDKNQQLLQLQAYVELSSLAEFWLLEEVGDESLDIIFSCLEADQKISADIIHYAAKLSQWKIVEVGVSSIAHLYPKMRHAGDLEKLSEEVVEMLRTEYVRYSQKGS
ncbi:BTB/POZ domain-containing protein At1g04390 isoform X2 [Asparagus officinalis]|uniref:BTB/POZ domain-containing protein At1g04390 isoform X2 n=1 Tax=Asparagus officinalis TaxID=4686 RepID=UPI00098E082D|nr:BTB/POZ domain-containing protein At1g04390 isoform X2 [Asparagus officinalis]